MAHQQLLRITPEKVIEFPIVLYSSSTVDLVLENISNTFVAFKVKTTAPKSYLVRPSTGIIPAGSSEVVHIVLQPLSEEPLRACTDRFLIQATAVNSTAPLARDYWQSLDKELIEDTRLSVVLRGLSGVGSASGAVGVADSVNSAYARGDAQQQTASSAAGTAAGAGSSGYQQAADLKNRYDQLVEYALALERHKEELAKENEALKQQLSRKGTAGQNCSTALSFFELWHFPVYIFIGIVIWYVLGRSGDSPSGAPLAHS